jgi:hypothetical protein
MGEWRYEYTHSWLRPSTDVSGQLHAPAALPPGTQWVGGSAGRRDGLNTGDEKDLLLLSGNSTPAFQPVALRYTDCTGTTGTYRVLSPYPFHSSLEKGGEVKPRFWEYRRGSGRNVLSTVETSAVTCRRESTFLLVLHLSQYIYVQCGSGLEYSKPSLIRINLGRVFRISEAKGSHKRPKLRTEINVKKCNYVSSIAENK